MTVFDPRTLGIEKSEFDAAITANPGLLEQFPEAREYADSLMKARGEGIGQMFHEGWIEGAKTSTDGIRIGDDIPGIEDATEEPPFVLEFALSRGGEILAISSLASEAPEGIPEWAWQAYLEGLVVSARGRAALRVCEEEGRIAGLFADDEEEGPWEDELFDTTYDEGPGEDDDFDAESVEPIF